MQKTVPAIDDDEIRNVIEGALLPEGPLLPILHALQDTFGHIPDSAIPLVAAALNIGRAEVHGVMSFYHDFRSEPGGAVTLKLCRSEACQAVGAAQLAEAAKTRLGVGWNETTPDGRVTLQPVYCLGMCGCGPAVLVDDRVVGRVDAARLDALLAEVGA